MGQFNDKIKTKPSDDFSLIDYLLHTHKTSEKLSLMKPSWIHLGWFKLKENLKFDNFKSSLY